MLLGRTMWRHLKSEQCKWKHLHGLVMSIFNMYHSILQITKKSGARGRHKWKWHKKTERPVCSLVAIANTKARGETLIEATEWHAQSNWISSAVSSNLIGPALWRMTGESNTFPGPPLPLGVPHTEGRGTHRRPTSTQQLANICCMGCDCALPGLFLYRSPHPRATPDMHTHTHTPVQPRPRWVSLPFSHLRDLWTLQGHRVEEKSWGDKDVF